jgi:zinc D-Ala-D-Ala carboxypeptidase
MDYSKKRQPNPRLQFLWLCIGLALLVAVALYLFVLKKGPISSPQRPATTVSTRQEVTVPEVSPTAAVVEPTASPTVKPSVAPPQKAYDQPGDILWVVNKKRPAGSAYVPASLVSPAVELRLARGSEQMLIRSDVAAAVEELFTAGKQAGHDLVFASGYRSYAYQASLYQSYVAKDGQSAADLYSARPGHSEHQTGLAFDVQVKDGTCTLEICFASTNAGKWLANEAHAYGFIIRYTEGKTTVTGYQFEPWHFRFVGKEVASEIFNRQTTLEEFFDLPAAATY